MRLGHNEEIVVACHTWPLALFGLEVKIVVNRISNEKLFIKMSGLLSWRTSVV